MSEGNPREINFVYAGVSCYLLIHAARVLNPNHSRITRTATRRESASRGSGNLGERRDGPSSEVSFAGNQQINLESELWTKRFSLEIRTRRISFLCANLPGGNVSPTTRGPVVQWLGRQARSGTRGCTARPGNRSSSFRPVLNELIVSRCPSWCGANRERRREVWLFSTGLGVEQPQVLADQHKSSSPKQRIGYI